jgi:hypothetical protein
MVQWSTISPEFAIRDSLFARTANDQQRKAPLYIPPSNIFFDKYRSAESGINVTTRFPAPSRFAISTAA